MPSAPRADSASRRSGVLLLIIQLLFGLGALAAQESSVQGIVTDESSGRPLDGAVVFLERGVAQPRTTVTDRNGYYQFGGVTAGTYTLRVTYIGYIPINQQVEVGANERATVSLGLEVSPVALPGVVAAPTATVIRRDLQRQSIRPADLRLVPVPAGSGDVASYLQTLPGVVTTGDRGGQLFIRGGTATENLALADGMLVYQPFHILGFFSAFPEELVDNADFYAGGFGARYNGRTSSVLDVQMRDGDRSTRRATTSISPFLADAVVEGPIRPGFSVLASARRSLIEETSPTFLGVEQPLTFESQFAKLSLLDEDGSRCSLTAMRSADRGRLDPEETQSRVGWKNTVFGGRCIVLMNSRLRLLEASVSYSSVNNTAVSRGSSEFTSAASRLHHEAHTTTLIGSNSMYAGYHAYIETTDYDLTELFGLRASRASVFGLGAYAEAELTSPTVRVRPGAVFNLLPYLSFEPRLRGSWNPGGRNEQEVTFAGGLYRQYLTGLTDTRDVASVFVAWAEPRNEKPIDAIHGSLGWQQDLGGGFGWAVEGFYRRMRNIPVPLWQAAVVFNTRLELADGESYGADLRLEYDDPRVYAFIGYGLGWIEYEAAQDNFGTWFGEPVQRYNPPHDRRHQVNALLNVPLGRFTLSGRWQLGTGLPFTRPIGFDEAFNFQNDLEDVREFGQTRFIVDRPYQGRLPAMHRLDVSVERPFEMSFGTVELQAGAINVYGRRNMFYYDLYTGRRVDQLKFTPYVSVRLRAP